MNRRSFLKRTFKTLSACGFTFLVTSNSKAMAQEKPNIVFILADDAGWGDLGCYGNKRFKTPHLDKMAEEGTLFTQFYSSGSVCSPSRAAFMTGQFPARLGVHGHFSGRPEMQEKRGMPNFLDPNVPTLPRLLKKNGYKTGQFGKWHLGHTSDAPPPKEYGFNESKSASSTDENQMDIWSPKSRPHATKRVMDATFDFIKENKGKPFYVQAWLTDTHATLNPSEEQMRQYSKHWWASPRGVEVDTPWEIYGGTLTEMDKQIGIFMERLKNTGLDKNTIVIFSSDNGPEDFHIGNASHSGIGHANPFRGRKRSIYEGGIRMPLIVRWPKGTPAGKINKDSVIAGVDLLPTLCSITGTRLPDNIKIDGEDMSPALKGKPVKRSKPLMWEWPFRIRGHVINRSPQLAIREGKYKLLMNPDHSRLELYNIDADPSEVDDIAEQNPEVAGRLSKKLLEWKNSTKQVKPDPEAGKNDYPWPGKNTEVKRD